MFYMRGDYPHTERDWRAEEERLRTKQAAKRARAEKAAQRKAARECHARPNDYAVRFELIAELHNNKNDVRVHGFGGGRRARKFIGTADDLVTAAPDDDPSEYDPVPFDEISCGRMLR